jgi:hypothetical protein
MDALDNVRDHWRCDPQAANEMEEWSGAVRERIQISPEWR